MKGPYGIAKFDIRRHVAQDRLFIYFGAANYETDVYFNGHKLGRHIGGFTPFAYEITGLAHGKDNSLVVRVNNTRQADGVPTINTDWWNYGGLTRDVLLVETPKTFIDNFCVKLKPGSTNVIEARVMLNGVTKNQNVRVSFPKLGLSTDAILDTNGFALFEFPPSNVPLWSPDQPSLNDVEITSGADTLHDRIGFRTISTRGSEILLNAKPVFLRGVSIHEENPLRGGRAWSEADARQLLECAKALGCNFVRLAHYPHNEHMARLADEIGIMVWEEIPVYWTINWTNSNTLTNAQKQLGDLIARDQNRASVIVWSVGNETPVSPARTEFLESLIDEARSSDGTRLVSAAMEVRSDPEDPNHRIVDDPLGQYTDLQFNEYVGWYDSLPDKIDRIRWSIKHIKPSSHQRIGADAKQGFHADSLTRFSEE